MAVGEVRLAWVAQGLRSADGRGNGWRGNGLDAGMVRPGLGISAAVPVQHSVVVVLVVVVALPLSWLATEMRAARRQTEAVTAIRTATDGPTKKTALRADDWRLPFAETVVYDYEIDDAGVQRWPSQLPGPEWLRKLLGDDFFISARFIWAGGSHWSDADSGTTGSIAYIGSFSGGRRNHRCGADAFHASSPAPTRVPYRNQNNRCGAEAPGEPPQSFGLTS